MSLCKRKSTCWIDSVSIWLPAFSLLLSPAYALGQQTFAQPYSAALRSDPAVGNVQGIQRYGRPLRTDPDQGEGYSYHVYPVTAVGGGGMGPGGTQLQSAVIPAGSFDWTAGLRNQGAPNAPTSSVPGSAAGAADAGTELQSAVLTRMGLQTVKSEIYQQPLIQIKMRVVEVVRSDGVAIGSVLEYVSRKNEDRSLTSGRTANNEGAQGFENFRSTSRFLSPFGALSASQGTGSLINLTSEHINWLVQGLATELSADVITAPEVVTLNGQNVEFVSGDKIPFELGQNVIQGSNNNIQQFFYKHVGTMVSVTPRIVNWGFHGEGLGERSIQGSEIEDWGKLIDIMLRENIVLKPGLPEIKRKNKTVQQSTSPTNIKELLLRYQGQQFVPFSVQSEILLALNNYSPSDVPIVLKLAEEEIVSEECCNRCKTWRPQDCTIDLAVVVRLSEGSSVSLPDPDDPDAKLISSTVEGNIRAVANVIQIQSGHGVVMAGLIGERELNDAAKVPVLGELPLVGALFRSKAVTREKTEVLIFVEAEVLDSDPDVARAQADHDFLLGQPFVQGALLDNPLEAAMHRIGFGTYLPPHSKNEQIYWEKFHRNVRKARTHLSDVVGP